MADIANFDYGSGMTRRTSAWIMTTALAPLLIGCAAEKFDGPLCAAPANSANDGAAPAFASGYFPPEYGEPTLKCGFFDDLIPIVGATEREWYPQQWQAASEPSLYQAAQCETLPEFVIRFSYIPSFDPSVFIRVQKDDDGFKLIAKQLTGAGGYEPGELGRSREMRLTAQQVMELQSLLQSEAFFDKPADDCTLGLDGSQWIFEMVDKDGYRMVKRWSPNEGPARNIGMYLIELSGWRVDTY